MHPLLSPIIDGFLNDNMSPEDLADHHKVSIREVLDLLLSEDAANIMRRLTQAEHLRQTVLSARARSKALSTLDYLTLSDRHSHAKDCDSRRRASEIILRQTSPTSAPSRAKALPAQNHPELDASAPVFRSIPQIAKPDPLFLCGPSADRFPRAPHSNPLRISIENLQAAAGRMNPASCTAHAARPTIHGSPDDG